MEGGGSRLRGAEMGMYGKEMMGVFGWQNSFRAIALCGCSIYLFVYLLSSCFVERF